MAATSEGKTSSRKRPQTLTSFPIAKMLTAQKEQEARRKRPQTLTSFPILGRLLWWHLLMLCRKRPQTLTSFPIMIAGLRSIWKWDGNVANVLRLLPVFQC